MAFWNALADRLRPRLMVPATGATSLAEDTTAATSIGARDGGPPPAADAPERRASMTADAQGPNKAEQQLMFHLSNVSHGVNHFQNQMMTMLWPSIMAALGLSYTQVGVLSAICSALNSLCQGRTGSSRHFSRAVSSSGLATSALRWGRC